MKKIYSFIILTIIVSTLSTSCEKTPIVSAIDKTFVLNTQNWNAFSFETEALMDSGMSTYYTTNEGVKFFGQAYRLGARIQTKSEFGFSDKTLYFKWKGNGGGLFTDFVIQIKYDPFSNDSDPAIQGVDLTSFTSHNSYNGSVVVTDDTWYYTRVVPVTGTDNYEVITSSGNYNNEGGTVIESHTIPIYTKSGYLAFRIGDSYSTAAYGVLGEVKIASN